MIRFFRRVLGWGRGMREGMWGMREGEKGERGNEGGKTAALVRVVGNQRLDSLRNLIGRARIIMDSISTHFTQNEF